MADDKLCPRSGEPLTQAEIDAERLDDYREALARIQQWCRAYPVDVFRELDREEWRAVDAYLTQGGFSLSRIRASNMRHVVQGVEGIVDEALK